MIEEALKAILAKAQGRDTEAVEVAAQGAAKALGLGARSAKLVGEIARHASQARAQAATQPPGRPFPPAPTPAAPPPQPRPQQRPSPKPKTPPPQPAQSSPQAAPTVRGESLAALLAVRGCAPCLVHEMRGFAWGGVRRLDIEGEGCAVRVVCLTFEAAAEVQGGRYSLAVRSKKGARVAQSEPHPTLRDCAQELLPEVKAWPQSNTRDDILALLEEPQR